MLDENAYPVFLGRGRTTAAGPWLRDGHEPVNDLEHLGHPGSYSADEGLVEAVNTALILAKPLLLTGRPGTGKSELAERIAWELGVGPVLRFEAQSLTEAQELFYRFDLVGQMADAQLAQRRNEDPSDPRSFLTFGALGKAILYANPEEHGDLISLDRQDEDDTRYGLRKRKPGNSTIPDAETLDIKPRRSVVLIDEIDKAARDVPNDLLNGIERMAFRIRELRNRLVASPREETLKPIVVITSNSERDLPEPFLRRCVYYNIPDPSLEKLAEILRLRVPGTSNDTSGGSSSTPADRLAPFYQALLTFFVDYRDDRAIHLAYKPGTAELLDWANALRRFKADPGGDLKDNAGLISRTLGAVLKHQDDKQTLITRLKKLGLDLDALPA